ncbi:TIGR03086 family metal-binding protein [Nocardiopsis oceani]
MPEIADRYGRLADEFTKAVAAVPPDRWQSPSPCAGWTALDVVRHVVDSHVMQLGLADREPGARPSVDEDPLGSVRAVKAAVHADLDDSERAAATVEGPAGQTVFEQSIDTFLNFDLVIHRWDLAWAAGLDERIATGDVRWAAGVAESFGDFIRADGVCGPELTPPPGADEQTRMLAYVGRQSW